MRDSQRQKVYDSEEPLDRGATFTTVGECQAYVDRVLARKRLQRRYPRLPKTIVVHNGGGNRRATALEQHGQLVIKLPKWARSEMVILHEIAHHVARTSDGQHWAHNWKFCAVYLTLIREMMGTGPERELRQQFRSRRVRFTEPRARRVLSEEERSAAADRLAAAREARLGERGRWALRTTSGVWCKRVTWRYGKVDPYFTGMAEEAMVWTTRPAVERWVERFRSSAWEIEIVDLSECSAAVH
jgi:putative metallohydrolase (TIGR04338 family)